MKIAVVFDNMIYGGIERVGINHIRLMQRLGHEVEAFVLTPKTEDIIRELESVCRVTILSLPRNHCPEAYWPITRRMRVGKYLFPFVYLIVSLLHYVDKIRLRVKKHYDVAIAFSGHYNDLSFVANNFISTEKKVCWLHGALYQYVLTAQGFENLYKKIKNLVVLVDDGQEEVIAYHEADGFDFNIKKIYNPIYITDRIIDDGIVDSLKKEFGDFLVMVSRMAYPHKDHYTVIKSIEILKRQYEMNLNLLLLGDGPEKEKLEKYCKELGVEKQVHFLGNKSDVQNYYRAAKLLVHASVAGEGLPTILLEAMALGTPVICTDSKVGPKEIIGNNEYGLLTKVKDPKDMAEKIAYVLNDEKQYAFYSKAGLERSKDFSEPAIMKKITELFEQI